MKILYLLDENYLFFKVKEGTSRKDIEDYLKRNKRNMKIIEHTYNPTVHREYKNNSSQFHMTIYNILKKIFTDPMYNRTKINLEEYIPFIEPSFEDFNKLLFDLTDKIAEKLKETRPVKTNERIDSKTFFNILENMTP